MTIFDIFGFWPYGPSAHNGACPYMGIGGGRKLPPNIFQILHIYRVSMQNSSLVSQFAVYVT